MKFSIKDFFDNQKDEVVHSQKLTNAQSERVFFIVLSLVFLICFIFLFFNTFSFRISAKGMSCFSTCFLIGSSLLIISYTAFFFAYQARTEINKVFIVLGLTLGLAYTFINPPGRVPDEDAHWVRSYELSHGKIFSESNQLPKAISEFYHVNYSEVIDSKSLDLDSENTHAVSSGNALLYSPIPYLPQSLGIFLARSFHVRPLYIYYFGRICSLIGYLSLIYLSLKIVPFHKPLFLLLALTPMVLHQAASFSADSFTNGLAFLLVAYFLNLAYGDESCISKKQLSILLLLSVLLALCKIVYLPLILLYFLIPIYKLKSKIHYFGSFIVIGLVASLFNFGWMSIASDYLLNHPHPWASPKLHTEFIINKPFEYIQLLTKTVKLNFSEYAKTFIGQKLNELDVSVSKNIVYIYFALIFISAISVTRKNIHIGAFQKGIFVTIISIVVILTLTSLFIQWTRTGAQFIEGVQGRYFIPLSPLFFLLFYNRWFYIRWNTKYSSLLILPVLLIHVHVFMVLIVHHL